MALHHLFINQHSIRGVVNMTLVPLLLSWHWCPCHDWKHCVMISKLSAKCPYSSAIVCLKLYQRDWVMKSFVHGGYQKTSDVTTSQRMDSVLMLLLDNVKKWIHSMGSWPGMRHGFSSWNERWINNANY